MLLSRRKIVKCAVVRTRIGEECSSVDVGIVGVCDDTTIVGIELGRLDSEITLEPPFLRQVCATTLCCC
jgi:hypothetical protein